MGATFGVVDGASGVLRRVNVLAGSDGALDWAGDWVSASLSSEMTLERRASSAPCASACSVRMAPMVRF